MLTLLVKLTFGSLCIHQDNKIDNSMLLGMWRNQRISVLGVVIIIFNVYQKVTELFALKLCDRRMRRWSHRLCVQGGEADADRESLILGPLALR